jgi:Bacterial protein of unknown function (DUF937)
MALDLVGLVNQVLTPQLVGSLARSVGVNEAVAQKLVAAAIPTVLAAFATTAAAPGGAQKVVDAVQNSDPDLLTKLAGALGGGNIRSLNDGANLLGGMLGGSGLSSLVGALSQHSGAAQPAAQAAIGAVSQAAIGALGQQDPSNWSDPTSIASMFAGQKDAIAAALPGEISKALGATGLLAGLSGIGAAAAQRASATVSSAATAASSAASAAASRPQPAPAPAPTPTPPPPAASSSGFPMWAIVLIIVIVLVAIWWFMSQGHKPAEPAKTGMLPAAVALVLEGSPEFTD